MARIKEILSSSLEETQKIAKEFAKTLPKKICIGFSGNLGAGKTTFIKTCISSLTGLPENGIQSPTFTYMNSYPSIYHFDLYRLKNENSFIEMGFEDYLHEGICFIEWYEEIKSLFPSNALFVKIEASSETKRVFTFHEKAEF